MTHTQSATPLSAIQVEHRGPLTDIWLRRNIRDDVADGIYGSDITYWEADEVYGVVSEYVTEDDVAANFDSLWAKFEEDGMSDRELAESRTSEIRDILGASRLEVATRNTMSGEYIVAGGAVYQAIVNIPNGSTLIEGMNVTKTNMEELFNILQERQ